MSNKMRVFYEEEEGSITDASGENSSVFFVVTEDGRHVAGMEVDANELPIENQHRVFLYGLNKLLTDRTSDQKNKFLKLDEMQIVFDLLITGEWAKERVVGAIVCSPEVEALAYLGKMSIPDVQAALGQYEKNTRTAILGRDDVQEAAKRIRKARKDSTAKTLDDMIPEA